MRRSPNCFRLGSAILLSLLLHGLLLLPREPIDADTIARRPSARPSEAPLKVEISVQMSERIPHATHQQTPPPSAQPAEQNAVEVDARGYFQTEQLSRPPRPLQDVDLDLPEARLLTAPGKLLLTLWIDTEGRVISYRVDAPDLPEEYTTAVAETFVTIRFSPGEILGRKVGSILTLQIDHQPDLAR